MDTGAENDRMFLRLALISEHRHIDSARYYDNEADVGRAVRECGVPREELFVSKHTYLE